MTLWTANLAYTHSQALFSSDSEVPEEVTTANTIANTFANTTPQPTRCEFIMLLGLNVVSCAITVIRWFGVSFSWESPFMLNGPPHGGIVGPILEWMDALTIMAYAVLAVYSYKVTGRPKSNPNSDPKCVLITCEGNVGTDHMPNTPGSIKHDRHCCNEDKRDFG